MTGWAAIAFGGFAALWTFHIVPRWWLALPAAVGAWLLVTSLVGALWALVRQLIELYEGVR